MRRHLAAAMALAVTLAGCGVAGSTPTVAPSASLDASASTAGASVSTAPSSAVAEENHDCDTTNVTLLHQAPDVEALLPASVANRPLARWSLRSRCWLTVSSGRPQAEIDELLASLVTTDDPSPIEPANLRYAVAGRSDTAADPPYFVFAAGRPQAGKEISLALLLLLSGASFHDPVAAGNLDGFEERTVAGKKVYVGTTEMLEQNDHQRGRPYLYQNDDYMFVVLTDDDAWATDAIAQLP